MARIIWQLTITAFCLFSFCFTSLSGNDEAAPPHLEGRLLFLVQQGKGEQALKLYQTHYQDKGCHDFELLHQIGLRVLDFGFRMHDPECKLLALFGASISAHEDAYSILEESIKSEYPALQMVAIQALARFQNDRADRAIQRALGSSVLEIRYEAVHQLCKKKHPNAVNQAESLMYKTPKVYWPLYPPLFASVGNSHSTRILRKLCNHTRPEVRLALILSVAKYQRDDLLPQIRQMAAQHHYALQEACIYALGLLKDEESLPKIEMLAQSQYSNVSLAASIALSHLGQEEAIQAIEQAAKKEDLFAIAALGAISDHSEVLLSLVDHPNLQVRLNAWMALLEQRHPRSLEFAKKVIIRDDQDLAFSLSESSGKTLKAWKATPSAGELLKDDGEAFVEHLELKKSVLQTVKEMSQGDFIAIAHQIFSKQQNELVSCTVELLEELGTTEAIECLKKHQQQFGAPLVRHYCNLALYRLHERGPYGKQLRGWVKTQSQTELIRFKPFSPWELGQHSYTLTPEESSKLLIESFEAFAQQQDPLGIELLIEAIATGHKKNKYALAGLLLRATQ